MAATFVAEHLSAVTNGTFAFTGVSPGSIAAATALAVATGNPAQIILIGRAQSKLDTTAAELRKVGATDVRTFVADFESLASVRACAEAILTDPRVSDTIDILVNSAHAAPKAYEKTDDGIERMFAVGHVSHFLLTNLLAPKLRQRGRVVNVTSAGHRLAILAPNGGAFDPLLERYPANAQWNSYVQYGQTKLATILFTRALAERGWNAVSFHPGPTSTPLFRGDYKDKDKTSELVSMIKNSPVPIVPTEGDPAAPPKTPDEAARELLAAALLDLRDLGNGAYVVDGKPHEPSAQAKDELLVEEVWKLSERLVGQSF